MAICTKLLPNFENRRHRRFFFPQRRRMIIAPGQLRSRSKHMILPGRCAANTRSKCAKPKVVTYRDGAPRCMKCVDHEINVSWQKSI